MTLAGRAPPSLVQTAVGQGSAVTLTDKTMGGASCWMKVIPTHGSAAMAYVVTIAGGAVRESRCTITTSGKCSTKLSFMIY